MENAVIYARYSSEKQNEQSIEGQLRVCNKYAKDHNMNIVETYIDRAKSGTSDNRMSFQKMIADSKTVTEKELARKEKQKAKETNIAKKNKLVDEVKELKHKISAFEQIAKELDEEKPVEKKKTFKQEMNQLYDAQDEAWEGFESGSDIKSSPENSKKFYERVKKFVDDNNIKLSQKHYDEIEEMNGHSFNEALELAGAYGEEKKEKALAKNREYSKKYKGQILDLSMIDEFKESDDENKTYWVQDSRGNRLTNEDAKSRIIDNNMQIFKLNGSNEPRKDMKIRELKNENEYLMDRLNPEDKAEVEIPDYASKLNSDESRKLTEELERLQEGGESEVEKTQNRSEAMKGNKNAYKGGVTNNPDKLKPIAKAEKIEDGKVKLPYSKEVSDEIKQLTNTSKDAVKKGSRYDFLTKLYYNKGNLVSTDGNKLKIVKVGNLDGIENGTFVDIDNTKEGITITADKDFTESHKFPLYERVIPQDNNEKIVLDNKALISKIRDLKKDGGITTKDSYVTFDIQGNDLMLDGVKVGDVSAANFEGENSDYINFDADILTSYLSGDKTELFSSKDSSKSMYFGNGSILNVIMPQVKTTSRYDSDGKEIKEQRRKDYNSMRKDKEVSDEIKTRSKALRKELNEGYVENIVNGYKRSVPANFEEKSIEKLKEWTTEQLQRMYKVANADIDSLMEKKDFNSDSFSSFCYKNFDMSPHNLIGQNYAMKDHPAIVREIERLVTERGGKLEKSLFDGFLGLELLEEDVDNIEKDREEESLWNDYSAEQPELFNSVELQVCEAMNRHYSNCL